MTLKTTLMLGDFVFARYEIPEQINFGGEQKLNVHDLVGGIRVIDALGATTAPIEWSGFFAGASAIDRALYVDGLRKAGKALQLTWGKFIYSVVIKSLHADYQNASRIPYKISCEVVSDLTSPVKYLTQPSVDQLVADDATTAGSLVDGIGDGTLSSTMATLNTAIKGVSSFAKATQGTLNTVLTPIAAVRAQVSILSQSANATIRNVTTLGGILPNSSAAQQAARLSQHLTATTNSASLFNLDRVLGRMSVNIGEIRK